ncbi:hypothetical protein DH2020_010841 [Rehmannia glutinosa]|uniref:RNase H type-1 domain-containing protein n=1 Tax=Rehmannia glutinosa TaxID=99300 RepID=A0ABR0XBR5_REHGL
MRENLDKKEFELFATLTWLCWKERQRTIHWRGEFRGRGLLESAEIFLNNYQRARDELNSGGNLTREDPESKWTPPPRSCLKLDVDASVNDEKGKFGIGGILRNHTGEPIFAFGKQFTYHKSVLEFELMVIEEGLKITNQSGFNPHIVGTDSLLVVQVVTAIERTKGYVELRAAAIHSRLKAMEQTSMVHYPRETNGCAHAITHFASSSPNPFVWDYEIFPLWLKELVTKDCNHISS